MAEPRQCLADLLPALTRLDARLAQAAADVSRLFGAHALADPYRGLHISADDIGPLLARPPGEPLYAHATPDTPAASHGRLAWLADAFGLSAFEQDVILISLAPELDLRYERLYAYLQDDVSRRRPTVDLALNLLCADAAEKLAARAVFSPAAPLLRESLMGLTNEPGRPGLLAAVLGLDGPVAGFLLGQDELDLRLAPFCRWHPPTAAPNAPSALADVLRQAIAGQTPLRLYCHSSHPSAAQDIAQATAFAAGAALVAFDIRAALAADADMPTLIRLALREARLRGAALCLADVDTLGEAALWQLAQGLDADTGIVLLTGEDPFWPSALDSSGLVAIPVAPPGFAQRLECWRQCLAAAGTKLAEDDVVLLAEQFTLTPKQIAAAATCAEGLARWRVANTGGDAGPNVSDVFAAARAQSGRDLAKLARKVEARHGLSDIVLPPEQAAHLADICAHAKHRHTVYGAWGFGDKLSLGKGMNILFAGPPGTGKTLAAEALACALRLDLYKIDLSQVVSKYIGETEKNLDRIFRAAKASNAILFFDEADALFGKRAEVKDAHDRYANIEVGYLLQKMEEYDGLAILATNLRQHLDEAFVRRMQHILDFPFPDAEHRRRIWELSFPRQTPLDADVDFGLLAREIRLAGGNIKNIVLAAAFHAADAGQPVGMAHLLVAAKREHQKLGRLWNELGALSRQGS